MAASTIAEQGPTLAVIGGSGLYTLVPDGIAESLEVPTPYDPEPVTVWLERTPAGDVWFLPRHGRSHAIAPHLINYRANLWALYSLGVRRVVAVNAVGGIAAALVPGTLVLPDQLIDYSWGREHTYHDGREGHSLEKHCDFTWPYDRQLGEALMHAAQAEKVVVRQGAVYASTQGPRLETAAEIRRFARDGCDIVGMTGMPEAALARELGIRYACLALVVNPAAGLGEGEITHGQIEAVLHSGIDRIRTVLLSALPALAG